jgi:hypothetical protein
MNYVLVHADPSQFICDARHNSREAELNSGVLRALQYEIETMARYHASGSPWSLAQ